MPLEVRNIGAIEEDIVSSLNLGVVFLNLQLQNVGRVLDNFGDIGPVTRADFAKDTLPDPNDPSNNPVALEKLLALSIIKIRQMDKPKKHRLC